MRPRCFFLVVAFRQVLADLVIALSQLRRLCGFMLSARLWSWPCRTPLQLLLVASRQYWLSIRLRHQFVQCCAGVLGEFDPAHLRQLVTVGPDLFVWRP